MAIDSLRDGFVRLCFDPSLNLVGDRCRLVLEGQYARVNPGAAEPDVLVKVTSTRDINNMFGEGTVLAESLKVAIACCGNNGVEIFALPRLPDAAATRATYRLTFTGTATTDGRIDIYWGDSQWNISRRVTVGDTAADIATDIAASMPAGFPYVATVVGNAVELAAISEGVVGNFLNIQVNWHGRNNYLPEGITWAQTQTIVGAGSPPRLDYSSVFGECCVCCWAVLGEGDAWQDGVVDYLEDAWSCEKPQCFGHAYTYNAGSLGQILADDTNSAVISRMAHCNTDPNFPWLKVAAYASLSCCSTVDNPELSVQGPNYGVLCVKAPETCATCFTYDEQEQLRDSGFVVTVPVSGGEGALTSPMITNDVTNNRFDAEGRENLTFQSVSSRRLATVTATAIADQLKQFNGLGYFTKNTKIREGTIGANMNTILGNMRAWAKSQIGVLFSEFDDLNKDLTFQDDFEVAPKCLGVPGKLYMNFVYRPPVRLRQINVNAAPKLLDNC